MNANLHPDFIHNKDELLSIIRNFDLDGKLYGAADRNTIKLFELGDHTINVKSFKRPNIVNRFVYRWFRKSKAQRSFEYAMKLRDLSIGTPQPIAYFESRSIFTLNSSFYVSKHENYDMTFRELNHDLDLPDHENIVRAFTRFTFKLHENNVLFLDHSVGNTLITATPDGYDFKIVDLNRMKFKSLSFTERIVNFRRLSVHRSMVETMSDEYAKISGYEYEKVVDLMWSSTQEFQRKFHLRRRLKKKAKFWK